MGPAESDYTVDPLCGEYFINFVQPLELYKCWLREKDSHIRRTFSYEATESIETYFTQYITGQNRLNYALFLQYKGGKLFV